MQSPSTVSSCQVPLCSPHHSTVEQDLHPCLEGTLSPWRPSSATDNPEETETFKIGAIRDREAEQDPAALSSAHYCCCWGWRASSTKPCPPLDVILYSEAQRTTEKTLAGALLSLNDCSYGSWRVSRMKAPPQLHAGSWA